MTFCPRMFLKQIKMGAEYYVQWHKAFQFHISAYVDLNVCQLNYIKV